MVLALSVKALNDPLGSEGIVPSAVVFGEFTRRYTKSEQKIERLNVEERAAIATLTRKEMSTIMALMRLERALKHIVLRASHQIYKDGDKVLVWRGNIVK